MERAYEARFVDKHREELEKIRPLEQELMDELLTGVRW